MLQQPEPQGIDRYVGRPLFSSDGEKIGSVEVFYNNRLTDVAEWIGVSAGFLGNRLVVVPVAGSDYQDDGVHVPYTKQVIGDAPPVEVTDGLTAEGETLLDTYFGLGANEAEANAPEDEAPNRTRLDVS